MSGGFSNRTTFPVPSGKFRARKLGAILKSPYSWAPFLPVLVSFAFLDVNQWISAGIAAAVACGVALFWRSKSKALEKWLVSEWIEESNDAQDREIIQIARKLLRDGSPDYAATLGSFLEKKQSIEKGIHADSSEMSPKKEELESLVDTVTFGVADQLQRLAQFDQQLTKPKVPVSGDQRADIEVARKEIGEQIHHAWDTVSETWENLGNLLNPSSGIINEDISHSPLENAISRLREEKEIAHRVRSRMESEWGERFGEEPADLSQQNEADLERE